MIIKDFKYKALCYYNKISIFSLIKVLMSDGAISMILYRLQFFFNNVHLFPLSFSVHLLNKFLSGCVIGCGAKFKSGFTLMHPIGVVINSCVRGGHNVVIESCVTIGASKNGIPVESPILGNNVFIGSGAKVLGGIVIGNNVKIGANAVVITDIPDNSTAVGIPAKIISNNNDISTNSHKISKG
jgi:serine O-acetyltransferase